MAKGEKRSAARLASVQALYQMEIAGTTLPEVLAQFESFWMGQEIEGNEYKPAEAAFFRSIVGGVLREQRTIDPEIDQALSRGWPLHRVEAILRAILRAGTYELRYRTDIPPRVVITEYTDLAHAFFEGEEVGMVNAVLDQLARRLRAEDLLRKVN